MGDHTPELECAECGGASSLIVRHCHYCADDIILCSKCSRDAGPNASLTCAGCDHILSKDD